jgi:hypothetical protein
MSGPPAQDKNVTFVEARAGIETVPGLLRHGAACGGVVWTMGAASCVVLAKTVEDGLQARRLLEQAQEHEAQATALLLRVTALNDDLRAEARRIAWQISAFGALFWLWAVLL